MNTTQTPIEHIALPPEGWQRPEDSNHELRLLREIVGHSPVNKMIRTAPALGRSCVEIAAYNVELYTVLSLGMHQTQDAILEA